MLNFVIKIKSFTDYIELYYQEVPKSLTYTEVTDRWKIGVIFDNSQGFSQVSFVNGILTYNGGTHVKYVTEQLCAKLTEIIVKKNKNK